jgi:hypothetical protein
MGDTEGWLAAAAAAAAPRPPDDLDLLCAIAMDNEVKHVLSTIHFELELLATVAEEVRGLGTRPAATVVDAAQTRSQLSAGLALLVGITEHPSRAVGEILRLVGVCGPEVATEAVLADTRGTRHADRSGTTFRLTVADLLLLVVTTVLLVRDGSGWWRLLLLPLVFAGPPIAPSLASAAVAALFTVLFGPLLGAAKGRGDGRQCAVCDE